MEILTTSLRNEIKLNPGNFYLNFDIYDLLFDWSLIKDNIWIHWAVIKIRFNTFIELIVDTCNLLTSYHSIFVRIHHRKNKDIARYSKERPNIITTL